MHYALSVALGSSRPSKATQHPGITRAQVPSRTALCCHSLGQLTLLCSFAEPDFRCAGSIRASTEVCNAGRSRPSMKVGFQVACSVDADHRLLKPHSWTVFWVVETSPIDVLSAHKQHVWRVFAHVEEVVVCDKLTTLDEAQ